MTQHPEDLRQTRPPGDLHVVDEYLGMKPGTIYDTLFAHRQDPDDDLRDRLRLFGIELDPRWDSLRKECRPEWQALMEKLGVGREWWFDPSYWDVPPQDIPTLGLQLGDSDAGI